VRPRWLAALLAVAVVATYARVAGHELLDYDDPRYVSDNPNLEAGLTWQGIRQDFREPYFGNWIPLTHLSLRIDHALYGERAAGYLLTNVALHAAATLLLFAALFRLTGAAGRSAFVAGVFGLHPLHVESVAWVSERKDVLSGCLWMATLLAYARYVERPRSALRGAGVLVAFGLGLLAKPMLVSLPLVLLLLDFWPLGRIRLGPGLRVESREGARVWLEKLPLAALAAGASWITLRVQDSAGALFPLEHLSLAARVANALRSCAIYALQSVWPSGLAAFHPLPLEGFPGWQIALAAGAVASATAAALAQLRSRPYLAAGWFWYLIALAPVAGLVQVGMQAHADRYTYLPQVGLALALAWGAVDLAARSGIPRRALVVGASAALGALAIASALQLRHWRDSFAVHERIVAVHPESFRAHAHLGGAYLRAGRMDEALAHFERAARLAPRWAPPLLGLADVALKRNETERALELYARGLALDPKQPVAQSNYGTALVRVGRFAEARAAFERAIAEQAGAPSWQRSSAEPHLGLGDALWAQGDLAGARQSYERGLALAPEHAAGHTGIAMLLLELGEADSAAQHLARARALGEDSAKHHLGQGILAGARGEAASAIESYRMALARDATLVPAQNNLAWLLATSPEPALRDPAEAVRLAEAAVRASARQVPAYLDTLAVALAASGRFAGAAAALDEALARAREAEDTALVAELERHRAQVRRGQVPAS